MGAGCAAEEESSCVGRARTRRQGDRAPDVSVCVCAPRRALVALQRRSEPGGGLLEARRPGPAPSRRAVRAAGLECRGRRGPRGPCACPGQPPSRTRLPDARAMHAQPQTQATPPRCACMPPPPPQPTSQPVHRPQPLLLSTTSIAAAHPCVAATMSVFNVVYISAGNIMFGTDGASLRPCARPGCTLLTHPHRGPMEPLHPPRAQAGRPAARCRPH